MNIFRVDSTEIPNNFEASIDYYDGDEEIVDHTKKKKEDEKNLNNEIVLEPSLFNEKDILDYKCVICGNVPFPKDAEETICCGYLFCKKCINQWLDTKESCPICKEKMLKGPEYLKNVKDNSKFVLNILNNLQLKCPNSCPWKGKLEDINSHLNECKLSKYSCKYLKYGCNFIGIKADIEKHENENDEEHLKLITSYIQTGEALKKHNIQFDMSKTIRVKCHNHILKFSRDDSHWKCDAATMEEGCSSPSPDFKTKYRFMCQQCLFNLCPLCVIKYANINIS